MRILGALAVLILAVSVAMFSPKVQKAVLDRVVSSLNSKFKGSLGYGSIRLVPFSTVVIEDAYLIDGAPYTEDIFGRGWPATDTLGKAGRITATFTLRSLLSGSGAVLSRAVIDDGEFNLTNEPDSVFRNNIARMFGLRPVLNLPETAPDIFRIHRVRLNNFHYTMKSFLKELPYHGIGIHWDDLDLYANIEMHDLKFSNLIMSGTVDRMDVREKSGYVLGFLSGKATVGRGKTTITDLVIRDEWSDLHLPLFSMEYLNSLEFQYFTDRVTMEGELAESRLSFRTLKYFIDAMPDNDILLDIASGHMRGTVNGLRVDNLTFRDNRHGVSGTFDCSLTGITDMDKAVFDVDGRRVTFTTDGLGQFISEFIGSPELDGIGKIARGKQFTTNVWAKGSLNDLHAGISAFSGIGSFQAHAGLKNLVNDNTTAIEGAVSTNSLDLGRILGIDALGQADIELAGSALLFKDNPHISVDSLNAGRLCVLGYEYSGIYAKGGYDNGAPYGAVVVNDTNLKALVSGKDLKYSADIAKADLRALNIDRRGGKSDLSLYLDAAVRKAGEELSATADIRNLSLTGDDGKHDIGAIRLTAARGKNGDRISMDSRFARADIASAGAITDIIEDLQYATTRRELDALYTDVPGNRACKDYRIRLNLYDSRNLLAFLKPDLYISENTSFDLSVEEGALIAEIRTPRIALGSNYLKNVEFAADNGNGRLSATVNSGEIRFGSISLGNAVISAAADDNGFGTTVEFDGPGNGRSLLNLAGELQRVSADTLSIKAIPEDSHIWIGDDRWTLTADCLEYRGGVLQTDNFLLSSGIQSLSLNGGINPDKRDTFRMNLENLDLSIAERAAGLKADLSGRISGKAVLGSPARERLELMASFVSDSLSIAGNSAGTFRIGSFWDDTDKKLNLLVQNSTDEHRTIDARAAFYPEGRRLEGTADLDGMHLSMLKPLLNGVFSEINGSLSGKIVCSGPVDNLTISGNGTRIDTAGIKVAFTGAEYCIDGPFEVSEAGIFIENLSITDSGSGKGSVSGRLTDLFSGMHMNVTASLDNLLVLDSQEDDNSGVYGNLAASGSVNVTGPADSLKISADVQTSGRGDMHATLASAAVQGKSELLTFYEPPVAVDPFEAMMQARQQEKENGRKSNLSVNARVRISPEVTVYADIDKTTGNVISATGSGDIDLDIDLSDNRILINGDYNITGGNYHFAVPGIVIKDLAIADGSSIKFGGDLMDSQVDIKAVYTTRTSLSNLTADTTSVATRRQVNCGLNISDKLSNPSIGFSIDIPDLDPVTKSQVDGALNTEDKVQKQFIALLLFNSFLPSETSGIVNNSSGILVANVADIMSGQLNNILQKLNIPLDFGFGYQQNTGGTDIFDVAVSTQLFNNRVVVGGSVGNRQYSTSTSANGEMVGDLDIEVKLNRSGQIRLKLFSHSADEYTSYLDYTQRNGAGISYQKEYNRISDLFSTGKTPVGTEKRKRTIKVEE